jgi:hypothetical protein
MHCSPQNTIATAISFWHRFFHKQSVDEFEQYDMAQTCVFVAGKAEETSRRLRGAALSRRKTMAKSAVGCRYNQYRLSTSASRPRAPADLSSMLCISAWLFRHADAGPQGYWEIKARLSDLEHVLLRALAFNVDAVHPHRFVLHFLEDLKGSIGRRPFYHP